MARRSARSWDDRRGRHRGARHRIGRSGRRPGGRRAGRPAPHPYVVLGVVLTAIYMQFVDVSIMFVAIPAIQRDLGASGAAVQLVIAGYQIAFACVLALGARLGDIYGRKTLFLTGMGGFTVASVACAAAGSSLTLVGARLVQGVFSGLMFPQVLAVAQSSFSPRQRGNVFGIYAATISVATLVGPLVGGMLVTGNVLELGWRAVFLVNVPVGVVGWVAATRYLSNARTEVARGVDVVGAVVATTGLFLLVFPLAWGQEAGWPGWVWPMLGAAVPVLVLFVFWERRVTAHRRPPLLHLDLFRDRAFRVGTVTQVVFFAAVPSFFFLQSLYLQVGAGHTALHAGLVVFPFSVGSGLASVFSHRVASWVGDHVLLLGTAILAATMLTLAYLVRTVGTGAQWYHLAPAYVAGGVGLGLFVAPVTTIVLRGVRGSHAGSASGVLATGQQIGGALGVAVIGTVFFSLAAPDGSLGAVPEQRAGEQADITHAWERILLVEAGVYAVAGLLAAAIPGVRGGRRAGGVVGERSELARSGHEEAGAIIS